MGPLETIIVTVYVAPSCQNNLGHNFWILCFSSYCVVRVCHSTVIWVPSLSNVNDVHASPCITHDFIENTSKFSLYSTYFHSPKIDMSWQVFPVCPIHLLHKSLLLLTIVRLSPNIDVLKDLRRTPSCSRSIRDIDSNTLICQFVQFLPRQFNGHFIYKLSTTTIVPAGCINLVQRYELEVQWPCLDI